MSVVKKEMLHWAVYDDAGKWVLSTTNEADAISVAKWVDKGKRGSPPIPSPKHVEVEHLPPEDQ